jgi:hypothetical protein
MNGPEAWRLNDPAAHVIEEFDPITGFDRCRGKGASIKNVTVEFDRNHGRFDALELEQLQDAGGRCGFRFSVDRDVDGIRHMFINTKYQTIN